MRHAHDELAKLAPSNDEEEWLAERRSLMMQAEKIVADLRDAQEAIAGESSSVAGLGGVMRRLERRRAQAPTLIDPVGKAIDATLVAPDVVKLVKDKEKEITDGIFRVNVNDAEPKSS